MEDEEPWVEHSVLRAQEMSRDIISMKRLQAKRRFNVNRNGGQLERLDGFPCLDLELEGFHWISDFSDEDVRKMIQYYLRFFDESNERSSPRTKERLRNLSALFRILIQRKVYPQTSSASGM